LTYLENDPLNGTDPTGTMARGQPKRWSAAEEQAVEEHDAGEGYNQYR